MNDLESRKQLLIAESELNRAHLISDWESLAGEFHALTNRAKTMGSLASAATLLISALSSFRRNKPAPAVPKTPWLQAVLKGAGMIGLFWSKFRPQHHKKEVTDRQAEP
jgi:hypothetical protein